jgi:multidrug resistance protein, MATE family
MSNKPVGRSVRNVQSVRSMRSSDASRRTGLFPVHSHTHSHLQEFLGTSPLAQKSISRDLQDEPDSDLENAVDDTDDEDIGDNLRPGNDAIDHSFVGSYRRPSFIPSGTRPTVFPAITHPDRLATRFERQEAREEERSLLRDNNIIPPKHVQAKASKASIREFVHHHILPGIPGGDRRVVRDEEAVEAVPSGLEAPTEDTPLIGDPNLPYGGHADVKNLDERWEEAIAAGKIKTTWQREAVTIARYSGPLMITFILQYSLTVASIFTLGHVGNVELGAASLASMSANITGFAIFQGLATSLDTLCAQAYGSGKKHLVGLQMQRMIFFLWVITIPIAAVWLCSDLILSRIVPEPEVARLAGLYLKILIIGAPGYAAFESAKRFFQAQGLFYASLYVLVICAPLNAFMNWFFVWQLEWGFVGAPIAVVITQYLLPLGLFIYVRFVDGMDCWPGFTKRAWKNWGPMIKLALPGVIMVEAECLAFELLTLASAYFGTNALAAQSILATLCSITWQLPFPLSIAASTRIANLIGATLADAAWMTTKVAGVISLFVGVLNWVILFCLREQLPRLFTSDTRVIELCAYTLPFCAAFQLFDAIAAICNGTLRGLGRQEIGGYVQLFFYYLMAMPISFGTAFGLGWELRGLWLGVAVALGL